LRLVKLAFTIAMAVDKRIITSQYGGLYFVIIP